MPPRRVAFIAFEPFPNAKGSGIRITQMVRALGEAGYRVELITLPGSGDFPLPGVRHRALAIGGRNFLARALAFRARVARELLATRPDVVHFRGIFEGQAALAYAREHRIPAIFEVNGLPSVELPYHYPAVASAEDLLSRLRKTELELLQGVDGITTQSQTTLAYLRARGLPAQRPAFVIPNGADLVRNPLASSADPVTDPPTNPATTKTVLYSGTLAPWQGISELLMATRRWREHKDIKLQLLGPVRRKWQRQLDRCVRRLKIADHVEFCGALSRPEVARHVEMASVCVSPLRKDTRNAKQGCSPIKLYEYMAAARPTVVTDLPATREIVAEDRGVLLSSPRPKVLAEAIVSLIEDHERCAQLGRTAQAWVREHATWERRRKALAQAYRSLGLN